jgi:RNA polymerase sigma-70 factor (ECF subfamily)
VTTGAAGSVEAVFREERGRLLATLVRQFGDLDLAEEVASEAVAAALEHWPVRDKAYAARLAPDAGRGSAGRAGRDPGGERRRSRRAAAYRRALELVGNEPERAYLDRRLAEVVRAYR